MTNKKRIRRRIKKSGIGIYVKADGSTEEFVITDEVKNILHLIQRKMERDFHMPELNTCQALLNFSRNIGKQARFEGIFKMIEPETRKWEIKEIHHPLKIKPMNPNFFSESFFLKEQKEFRYPQSFFGDNYITQRLYKGDIIYTANLIEDGFHFKMDFIRKNETTFIIGESREKIDE